LISIVIPTIKRREHFLRECLSSYAATTTDYEVIIIEGKPACGPAWVEGADRVVGDYIHFSADDLRAHVGWSEAACEVVDRGFIPAPRILNSDGSIQSCGDWGVESPTGERTEYTRIPFLSKHQWSQIRERVIPLLQSCHYYTDNAISWAARELGVDTGVHRDYLFTHSLAIQGRGAGMTEGERMQADFERFDRWRSGRSLLS
jgi:hypothetical protein